MISTRKITVAIFRDEYTFLSDEPETHIVEAAKTVDALMQNIARAAQTLDGKRVAVLTALRIASKTLGIEQELLATTDQIKNLIKRIDKVLSCDSSVG